MRTQSVCELPLYGVKFCNALPCSLHAPVEVEALHYHRAFRFKVWGQHYSYSSKAQGVRNVWCNQVAKKCIIWSSNQAEENRLLFTFVDVVRLEVQRGTFQIGLDKIVVQSKLFQASRLRYHSVSAIEILITKNVVSWPRGRATDNSFSIYVQSRRTQLSTYNREKGRHEQAVVANNRCCKLAAGCDKLVHKSTKKCPNQHNKCAKHAVHYKVT